MWLDDETDTGSELLLLKPLVNTAGFLGFYPTSQHTHLWQHFGAFITNPISFRPRKPSANRLCANFPGGILLHTGWPNPGFDNAFKRYALRWSRSRIPVIVHLLAEDPDSLGYMAQKLETCENVLGIELGFAPGLGAPEIVDLIKAAQCELPLVAEISLNQVALLADDLEGLLCSMLHIGGTRGTLPANNGHWVTGRLYSNSYLPQVIECIQSLAQKGIKMLAGGGVRSRHDADMFLIAGTTGVALDTVLWYGKPDLEDWF